MNSPETFKALLSTNSNPHMADVIHRTKTLCVNINEFLYKSAHEPSLAAHRIQEHCHKMIPLMRKERISVGTTTSKIEGVMFDLIYTSDFLNKLDESMHNSTEAREVVSELASRISAASSRGSRTFDR